MNNTIPTVNFGTNRTQNTISNIVSSPSSQIANTISRQEFYAGVNQMKASEGITDIEALTRGLELFKSKGYSIEGIDIDAQLNKYKLQVEAKQYGEEDKGFMEAIKETLVKRGNKGAEILARGVERQGGQTAIESGVQYGANLIAGLADVIGVGVIEGLDAVTPEVLENKFKEGIQTLAQTKGGQVVAEKLMEVNQNMEDLRKYNPRVARNFEALGDTINAALTFYTGGAATKGVKSAVDTGIITKAGELAGTTLKKTGEVVGDVVKGTAKLPFEIGTTLTAKMSGLNRETLNSLFKNPELVAQAQKGILTRESLASKVIGKIDDRIDQVSGLGKEYQNILKGNIASSGDELQSRIGVIIAGINNKTLTKADQNLLDDAMGYINRYTGDITDNELHSLRKQIDSIKFDPTTGLQRKLTPTGNRILSQLRSEVDNLAGEKIPGLKELDARFGPEIQELNKVKSLVFDAKGQLKENYIQQIANLLGSGKEMKLERIRKLVPEIENEINALKAFADVELAKGNKIGTYVQSGGLTLGLTGTIDPITTAITLILTSPTIVSNLVKGLGYSAQVATKILNKVKSGIKLSKAESKIVGKAIMQQVKDGIGDGIDNLADKLGTRMKFMGNDGIGVDKTKLLGQQSAIKNYEKKVLMTMLKEARETGKMPLPSQLEKGFMDKIPLLERKARLDEVRDFIKSKVTLKNEAKEVLLKPKEIVKKPKTTAETYGMQHRPTKNGATADDISKNGEVIPKDFYETPQFYFNMKDKTYKESFDVLKKIKGNPNAEVTIYRAGSKNQFNDGDWVTLSKTYAQEHMERQGSKGVFSMKVKAKDIQYAGDDINEFGYFPQANKPKLLKKTK